MNILKKSILNNLKLKMSLFKNFENVYLFGSVLYEDKAPNDIDILLVYSQYSSDLIRNLNNINSILSKMFAITIDLTVLSLEELKETNFLKKLNFNYIRLK